MSKQNQIIESIKKDLRQRHFITQETLGQLKKILDEMKTSNSRSESDMLFKEQIMERVLESLSSHPIIPETPDEVQKSKKTILQILEKDFVSTTHNLKILDKLVEMLQKDSEEIAIQASKTLDFLIKHVNQSTTQVLDKRHYIPLLEFLKERSEFLLKLSKHLDDAEFAKYRKLHGSGSSTEDRSDRGTIPNSKSIEFFTLLPNLLIHFMAYVDIWKGDQDQAKIKHILRQCIHNIIQAPRKIPYPELLLNMNQQFNSKIFAVMIKFLQYMYILFKTQKEDKKQNNNKNLKRHFKDQIEHIKIHEVLMNFLYLVKNCPEDFPTSRTEVINRLKLFIGILSNDRLQEHEAHEVIKELLNEDVIFGKNKFMGEYSRNLITNHWLDSIKSPIIIHHLFRESFTNIKVFIQKDVNPNQKDFVNSFYQIEVLFNSIMKIIFDNSLYLSIQERALETLSQLLDKTFPKNQDNEVCNLLLNGIPEHARQFHTQKIDFITRLLEAMMRKFGAIDKMFKEITKFVHDKKETIQDIKDNQKKIDHIQLQSLPSPINNVDWDTQRGEFVEKNPEHIDSSLLTLNSPQNKFLSIFQEEEELTLNSCPIKPNNAYNYIKDVKNKIMEKCIGFCQRVTEIFISQNLVQHTQAEMSLLKSVYYFSPMQPKKMLTAQQCQILGNLLLNGLKVFEQLHDYDFHADEVNKKVHLRSFMLIFAHIYDPINFRDIFEPNMEIFFKHLLKYAKHCSDNCLQWVLIEPFCASPQSSAAQPHHQTFNKNIVELLIYNLIIKLEHSPDQLDPFHPFYQYKDQYFSLLQKLIRFPFRCLSRYSDDSFIRNYFRQIVLFLIKKSHTSRYSLDYLHLMRTLFKNILYNCTRENTSPLFVEFQAICTKAPPVIITTPQFNNFSNVNVLENLHKLFETGIPELADIITELVIMLPLKSKHIIQYARQGFIVKPLLHCLCMMNDYNYTLRTIKTFEIIISHSSSEEIAEFLEPIKFKLINRLFEIVGECKINELRSEKIPQDLSSLALKLLAKLGALPRTHQQQLCIQAKDENSDKKDILQLAFYQLKTEKKLKLSLVRAIESSIAMCERLMDLSYQANVYSVELIESSFDLLRKTLPLVLEQMHDLSQKLIFIFASLLSLHSKYVTVSPALLARFREGVREDLKKQSDFFGDQLSIYGLTDYSRFFLKCLLKGLSEKVLITRQDQGVPEISQEPKAYLWSLLKSMLGRLDPLDKRHHIQVYTFLFEQLMYQCIDVGINHKNSYNLPMKQASLAVLYELIDMAPEKVIFSNAIALIETVFIVAGSLTDLLNLKIGEYPKLISDKLFSKLLKSKYLLQHESWREIFTRILNNLVSYSTAAHNIAMNFLNLLCKIPDINLIQLLYERPWAEIQDTTSQFTLTQSKYSIKNIIQNINAPIIHLIKPAQRIFNKVNQTIGHNENILRLMTNTFNTLRWLMAVPFENKKLQAFSIISEKANEQGDVTYDFQQSLSKVIEIAHYIININEKEYGANIKIILETVPASISAPINPPVNPNIARNARDRMQPPTTNLTHSHSINPSIYFDDEEYNLNIEDIDLMIKVWGDLLSSIIGFLKQTQLGDNVFTITKMIQKRKAETQESPEFINKRSVIIFTLFNLIARVDRKVRNTAYKSLKELIAKEEHPKELLANEEKLKNILKPMLFCLQQQFKRFTPSLLFAFKKILKLLTQCFNSAVIQKLEGHLCEIEKSKDADTPPSKERQGPVTYAELMHEMKCISSLLSLFQYLSFAYQSTNPRYTISSIQKITGSANTIAEYFTHKLGRQTVKPFLKQNIAKLLNTMSPLFPGQVLFSERNSNCFVLIKQILTMDLSYCIRQRMTRDFGFAEKLIDYSDKNMIQFSMVLDILKILSKRNNYWFRRNVGLANRLLNKLNIMDINKREKDFEIVVQLLVKYARQNTSDIKILFELAKLLKIRCTVDLSFLRSFFKYDLYNEYEMPVKKKIFLEFMNIMKDPNVAIQDKIVLNYNMIYQMLLQANKKDEIKILISQDGNIIEAFIDLLKETLSVKQLQTRNPYNYRVAIEVLQLSSFIIRSLELQLSDYKRPLLPIIWALLKADDKMLKNYAFICISNFIRIFDIGEGGRADNGRVLTIYLTLLKGMQALTQNDFELGALNRKALNILIPYWGEQRSGSSGTEQHETETSWIGWTLRILHDESNEPFRLVRFWQIVVKNHDIFQKSKEGKFETQMINSMQWLMVASNPASNSPMVKRIASDLSFIYIQWKYKDVCDEIQVQRLKLVNGEISEETFEKQRKAIIDKSMNQKAADICLNFFIKVAFHNCTDKEDKDIMKRFLYLLKKMLVLWPNTKKKFDQIETVIRKLRQNSHYHNPSANPSLNNDSYLRFHSAFLNIINILLEFEQDHLLQGKLMMIFNLFELVSQSVSLQRVQTGPPLPSQSNQSLFTVNNAYLLHLIVLILKRLLKVAYIYKDNEDSQTLIKELKLYVKEGLENYVLQHTRTKGAANIAARPPTSNRSFFKIELVISTIKLLYDIDKTNISSCLNHMKQVAGVLKKTFEVKSSNTKDVPLAPLDGTFNSMLERQSIISLDLFTPQTLSQADDNYEKEQMSNSYICKRLFMVMILRIIAAEFNNFHLEDKNNIMEIFSSIHNKTTDPAFKSEILNLWRCMFLGREGFANGEIPERYEYIDVINFVEFSLSRVFIMLFDDTSKFAEHFDKRKAKPLDQNLNLAERIHEQINTKLYFNFLCQVIRVHGKYAEINQFKLFALFACKVCDNDDMEPLFELIESVYGENIGIMYTLMFEDFKEFNCSQEYLQGDEVMLLFTRFLYRLVSRNSNIVLEVFGSEREKTSILQLYNTILRSENPSSYQDALLEESFNVFVELLPDYNKLSSIITDYLLKANVTMNEGHNWGLALVKMALKKGTLSPQQLYLICSKIGQWGILQYNLENTITDPKNREMSMWILDKIYSITSEPDLLHGFRMNQTSSKALKDAFTQLQQREYCNALSVIDTYQTSNKRDFYEMNSSDLFEKSDSLQKRIEKSYASDIIKECLKELGEWDCFIDSKNKSYDMEMKVNFLFTERDDKYKDKIRGIVQEFEGLEVKSLPYFYGKTILNFLESSTLEKSKECFREINVSLLYSLLDWMNLPKYSKYKQNQILVKTQCLLELEEGNKIKEETISTGNPDANHEAMTKVVQSIFNQINTWRERLPHKFENMSTWKSILDQRNMIFRLLRRRMTVILDNIIQGTSTTETSDKLLIPYQDIEWNTLTLIKQQRTFGVYSIKKYKMDDERLYQDEIPMKIKQLFRYNVDGLKNFQGAKQILDKAAVAGIDPSYKIDYQRQKGDLLMMIDDVRGANNLFFECAKGSQEQTYGLYKDWLNVCFKGYEGNVGNRMEWARNAITLLPNALKGNSKKIRLEISTIFTILSENMDNPTLTPLIKGIISELPIGAMLLWVPQLASLILNPQCVFSKQLAELLEKGIGVDFPQAIFYTIKKYKILQLKPLREIYTNIRKIKYNLLSKMESMVNLVINLQTMPASSQFIPIPQLGGLARCFSELFVPSYDFLHQKFENEMQKIPLICRVGEVITTETRNGKVAKVINFLASDDKHYFFRIEKRTSTLQSILAGQCVEIISNSMEYSRESFVRKLRAKEVSKTFLNDETALVPTSPHTLTLLDILNNFMKKTSFSTDYPDNDTSYSKLPIHEANKLTHKRMLQIVPEGELRRYIESKSKTLDDYYMFRKQFGYSYGPNQLINFIFGNECLLSDITLDMSSANIEIDTMRLKSDIKQNPYAVRLSRNIHHFLTDAIIFGAVLPSMIATVSAVLRPELKFKSYLMLLFKELVRIENLDEKQGEELAESVWNRLKSLTGREDDEEINNNIIPSKMRIVLETAKKIGSLPSTPINLKYWF